MSVSSIASDMFYPSNRKLKKASPNSGQAFQSMMNQKSFRPQSTLSGQTFATYSYMTFPCDTTSANCIGYEARGGPEGHNIYIAEKSTADDPVALVKGTDKDGKNYELEIHINQVNPNNATYLEMDAVQAYSNAIGDKGFTMDDFFSLQTIHTIYGFGDFEKLNYCNIFQLEANKARAGYCPTEQRQYQNTVSHITDYYNEHNSI